MNSNYKKRHASFFMLFLFTSVICNAQTWYKANNPFGGRVIEMHTTKDSALLCATTLGLYKSTDNGENWNSISGKYAQFAAVDINSTPSGMYITSFSNNLRKSSDGGQNWDTIKPVDWTSINKIIVNKSGQIFLNTNNSVWRSSDNGKNWTKLTINANGNRFNTIDISPDDELFASTYNKKIFRSINNGDDWKEVYTAAADLRTFGFHGNNTIYAGTLFSGLYKSTDNGDSWSLLPTLPGSNGVLDLSVNNAGVVFAAIYEKGVYKSGDGGMTWQDISSDLLDPVAQKIFLNLKEELFVGTASVGVYKLNGTNWAPKNKGITAIYIERFISIDGVLYACTAYGIFISKDGGKTWQQSIKGMEEKYIVAVAKAPNGDLYAGGDMLYYSKDGIQWNNISQGFPSSEVTAADILIEANGRIIVATDDYGIRYSDDNGQSWKDANNGLDDVTMAFIRKNSQGYYFTADGYNLYRSNNLSGKWEIINTGITDTDITEFTVGNGALFAISFSDGLFKSVDNGNNWTLSTDQDFENVTVNGNDVYASSIRVINGGVFLSKDNGDTWKNISKGLPYESAEQVTYVSGQGLFAHVRDYGLYTLDFNLKTPKVISEDKLKIKCKPNPFAQNTMLELELEENFIGTYSIYTLQGQMVFQSEKVILSKGTHSFSLGENLLQGSYLVILNNGRSIGAVQVIKN